MSLTRKHLLILVGIVGLLALGACTREITTIVQEEPQPSSCFACHSDVDQFLMTAEAEWAESMHGEGETLAEGANASCVRCHCNEGFLQYVEDPARTTYTATAAPLKIGCFTCHAPHTNGDFGLRKTTPSPLVSGEYVDLGEGNTCVSCHQARRDVNVYVTAGVTNTLSTRWGPHHGPQGDLLMGSNGYEYAGYSYEETPYHRQMNADGCVDCHMKTVGLGMGGHTFAMTAVNEETLAETFNPNACKGCHEDIGTNYDLHGVQTDVDAKILQLQGLLITANVLDSTTLLPKAPAAAPNNKVSPEVAGAVWNYLICKEDRSHGVHNPNYVLGLLQSAINYMTPTVAAK